MSTNAVTVNWPTWLISQGSWTPPLPSATRGTAPLTPNANAQSTVDTSVYPLDMLLAAGFTISPGVGATSARPTYGLYPGQPFFDSTLGTPIWRNAANTGWVNASGSSV